MSKVFKYGDDVNTDVIFPGKYTYTVSDPKEMAQYAMEDLDPDFVKNVKAGDVVVGGKNFGCGSSREQAATCLREIGVKAVIAESFARIYFRNAINCGLAVIESPEAVAALSSGDEIEVDLTAGIVRSGEREFKVPALPPEVMEILTDGGLIPHTIKKLTAQ